MGKFSRNQRDQDGAPAHLPLPAGPISNGEFVPDAPNAHDRAVNELIRSSVDHSANVLGMDRRRFLQSAGAVAASLAAFELAGCASPTPLKSAGVKHHGGGGTFTTPPSDDIAACQQALGGGGEFIFEVHTHHVIAEFQDIYGFPALTDDVKAGVFGLNAAKLFGVDPTATRCALTTDPLSSNVDESAYLRNVGALPSPWSPHGPTTRRQVLSWLASPATNWAPSYVDSAVGPSWSPISSPSAPLWWRPGRSRHAFCGRLN